MRQTNTLFQHDRGMFSNLRDVGGQLTLCRLQQNPPMEQIDRAEEGSAEGGVRVSERTAVVSSPTRLSTRDFPLKRFQALRANTVAMSL